jgi:hypothetical protein
VLSAYMSLDIRFGIGNLLSSAASRYVLFLFFRFYIFSFHIIESHPCS